MLTHTAQIQSEQDPGVAAEAEATTLPLSEGRRSKGPRETAFRPKNAYHRLCTGSGIFHGDPGWLIPAPRSHGYVLMECVQSAIAKLTLAGFMTDRGRCNVAMTRAKGVLWILGGALDLKDRRNVDEPLSPFPKLKKQMEKVGRVHKMSV